MTETEKNEVAVEDSPNTAADAATPAAEGETEGATQALQADQGQATADETPGVDEEGLTAEAVQEEAAPEAKPAEAATETVAETTDDSAEKSGSEPQAAAEATADDSAEKSGSEPQAGVEAAAEATAETAVDDSAEKSGSKPEAAAETAAAEPAEAEKGSEDFASALAEFEQGQEGAADGPKPGTEITGKILSIGDEAAFVDVGGKAEGQIPVEELKNEAGELIYSEGDEVKAVLTAVNPDSGAYELHARVGDWAQSLADLKRALEYGLPVEGMVTGVNKGGVEVKLAGIRAFCPLSQLEMSRVEDPFPYANRRLIFRILRIEDGKKRRRPNVVLSRRAVLEEKANEKAREARERLEVGAEITGKVTSLTSYGAFVDLGGVEGLLHVSEIDHNRVGHPKEVLTEGQDVTVKITKIEKGKGRAGRERISLSRKELMEDPWEKVKTQFPEGELVKGKVVRLAPFGAFVELMPGIDGLVHISELDTERRISHPREAVKPDQEVEVTVLRIDAGKRRISLSMKPGAVPEVVVEGGSYESAPTGSFGSLGDFFKNSNLVSKS